MKSPTRREYVAGRVVSQILGGRERFLDDGSRAAQVDFEIVFPSRRPIALEVSRITDEQTLRVAGALATPWALGSARYSWHLYVKSRADFSLVRAESQTLLPELERLGVYLYTEHVPVEEADPRVTPALRGRLRELGVGMAMILESRRPPSGTGQIDVPWRSGPAVAEAANLAVELEARNNVEKLTGSSHGERHLFLWADSLLSFGSAAFLPTPRSWEGSALASVRRPPRLPEGIDAVWVAHWPGWVTTGSGQPIWPLVSGSDEFDEVPNVWRSRPPADWELLGAVRVSSG
jgi:hypothetical protein